MLLVRAIVQVVVIVHAKEIVQMFAQEGAQIVVAAVAKPPALVQAIPLVAIMFILAIMRVRGRLVATVEQLVALSVMVLV